MTKLQDTIHFELSRERTVVNETVKVVAQIAALVTGDDDAALRSELRATMDRLIPGAEWQFSNLTRVIDQTGTERLTVTATTRVSETENANLDGRAKLVSRPGLTVSNIHVDTAIPRVQLDKAASDLRVEILQAAQDEARRLSEVFGASGDGSYRVYLVNFNGGGYEMANNRSISKGAIIAATSYGSGFSGEDVLGNAQKIVMNANITLARPSVG